MTTELTYAVATVPTVLYASESSTQPEIATVVFAVSCPVGQCLVSQLRMRVPVGGADDSAVLSTAEPAASITSSQGTWTATPGPDAGDFFFTPTNGPVLVGGAGITIQFTGIVVSPIVGTAVVDILEWAVPSAPAGDLSAGQTLPVGQAAPPTGRTSVAVSKFPRGFFLGAIHATPQTLQLGDSTTLSWDGSPDGNYAVALGSDAPQSVPNAPWTSPPLYTDTLFTVSASTTVDGQTVSLSQWIPVAVIAPRIVLGSATPRVISPGDAVTMQWAAADADGVYFYDGLDLVDTLPPQSQGAPPVTITPRYGRVLSLVAFRGSGSNEVTSNAWTVQVGWAPPAITAFTASPSELEGATNQSVLSWQTIGAASTTLNTQTVAANDGVTVTPGASTSYDLVITGVTGSTVSATTEVAVVPPAYAEVTGTYAVSGEDFVVQLTVPTEATTEVEITTAEISAMGPPATADAPEVATAVPGADGTAIVTVMFPGQAALAQSSLLMIAGSLTLTGAGTLSTTYQAGLKGWPPPR